MPYHFLPRVMSFVWYRDDWRARSLSLLSAVVSWRALSFAREVVWYSLQLCYIFSFCLNNYHSSPQTHTPTYALRRGGASRFAHTHFRRFRGASARVHTRRNAPNERSTRFSHHAAAILIRAGDTTTITAHIPRPRHRHSALHYCHCCRSAPLLWRGDITLHAFHRK